MSITKMESLLKENALYFRRADLFEDPLEGKHSAATLAFRPIMFAGAKDTWLNKTMPKLDERTRKCVYVNCWHNNESETAFMWEKYACEGKGVAIKSSLNRIRNAILDTKCEFLVHPVNYIDYEKDPTSDANSFHPFFCKDKSYQDEKEVRFAFIKNFERVDKEEFDTLTLDDGVFIPVNCQLLIERIVLSPETNEIDARRLQELLRGSGLGNKFDPLHPV